MKYKSILKYIVTSFLIFFVISCKTNRDVYFNPVNCIISVEPGYYFQGIDVSFKGELIYHALPRNKIKREFNICSPDTLNFKIQTLPRSNYLDIQKFSKDSGFFIFIQVIAENNPQEISIAYSFDMDKIQGKKEIIYGRGIWKK